MTNDTKTLLRELLSLLSESSLDEAFASSTESPDSQYAVLPNFRTAIDSLKYYLALIGELRGLEKFGQLRHSVQMELVGVLNQLKEDISELKAAGTERIPAFISRVQRLEALLLMHDLFGEFLVQRFKNFQHRIDDGEKLISELTIKNETLFTEAIKTKEEIDKLLERAVGKSLFHTFEERRKLLESSRKEWEVIVLLLLANAVLIAYLLIDSTTSADISWKWIANKLALAIPLIYVVRFCAIQHSRDRKLEEEYAFKGSISLSLEAYRGLVERIVSNPEAAKNRRYVSFLVSSISKIFSSPTVKVFHEKDSMALPMDKRTLKLWIAFFNSIKK